MSQTAAYRRGRAVEGTRYPDGVFVQTSIPNERNAFVTNLVTDIEMGERVAVAMEHADIARGRS